MRKSSSGNNGRTLIVAGGVALAMLATVPAASAADVEATEGETMKFKVDKPNAIGQTTTYFGRLRYSYRTEDGTATAGQDYAATSGKVTFGVGAATKYVSVQTHADDLDEAPGETFTLKLSDPEAPSSASVASVIWEPTSSVPQVITLTGKIVE